MDRMWYVQNGKHVLSSATYLHHSSFQIRGVWPETHRLPFSRTRDIDRQVRRVNHGCTRTGTADAGSDLRPQLSKGILAVRSLGIIRLSPTYRQKF